MAKPTLLAYFNSKIKVQNAKLRKSPRTNLPALDEIVSGEPRTNWVSCAAIPPDAERFAPLLPIGAGPGLARRGGLAARVTEQIGAGFHIFNT
jgi:hypothetical protein